MLKGVYQQLIDPKDRHELGEYYTPDWLCERIVDELLPKHGYKAVLDHNLEQYLDEYIAAGIAGNPDAPLFQTATPARSPARPCGSRTPTA